MTSQMLDPQTPPVERSAEPKNGSALLCEALQAHGVTLMFGYPGGAALPLYRELARHPRLRHLLVRHEENAALAADGYARASGRPGVCLATSGPGATNLLTGLANAMMDSVPVLAITGQVATAAIGTQAFQEVDIVSMARPVTKAALQARTPDEVPELVAEAFRIMLDGRPGPVLLDLPKDVQLASAGPRDLRPLERVEPPVRNGKANGHSHDALELDGASPRPRHPDFEATLDRLAALIRRSDRPLLLAGHGVLLAGATDSLRQLAEHAQLPTTCTLLGLGALPASHPLYFGLAGMHGSVAANLGFHFADLVIGLGARFDDRVVGRASDFAPNATVVHVDVDPAAFGRVARCDLAVLGDARQVLDGLLRRLVPGAADRAGWLATLTAWNAQHADCLEPDQEQALTSPDVLRALARETRGEAVLVADVGQHQMYAAIHVGYDQPGRFFTSGGLGTMGYAVPAAMGVKLADPKREVWAVVGDGGFQMSAPELNTLAANQLEVKIALLNNSCLGMVRQWQELFYDGVYSQSILPQPDFVRLAEAHGVPARLVERREDLAEALRWARATPGPVLLDLRVPLEETVLPMVPAGAANGEVLCAEGRVLPA